MKTARQPPALKKVMQTTLPNALDLVARWLEWFFILQPTRFFLVWIITAAGLSLGIWRSVGELFWHAAWDGRVFLVFIGVTLLAGAAHIQGQLKGAGLLAFQPGSSQTVGFSAPPDRAIDPRLAWRLGWACLGLGVVLVVPAGWLGSLSGLAIFLLWGMAEGWLPALGKGTALGEVVLHTLAGMALFFLGWSVSGLPLSGNMHLAIPYMLGIGGAGAMATLAPDADAATGRAAPAPARIVMVTALATVGMAAAGVLGYRNGDPVISTTAVLTLPFYAVTLAYRREKDVLRTIRYSILTLAIFVGARYPLLFIPLLINLYLVKFYYHRRYGYHYPAFQAEHE